MTCYSPYYYTAVNQAYDIMCIVGRNGCTVLPEGLLAKLDDAQLQRLKNKMLMLIQQENKAQKRALRENGRLKSSLDSILDQIIAGDKCAEDFAHELEDHKQVEHLCNKVWDWWMQRKKKLSDEELQSGLERCLGKKLKKETEKRLIGDSQCGEDIELCGYVFSSHAIERARERIDKLVDKRCIEIATALLNDIRDAREAECKQKYKAIQLLNHNLEKTRYLISNKRQLLYVVVGNVVKTVHLNESKRFKRV